MATLLLELRNVGAGEQVTALAARAASDFALDDLEAVAALLRYLWKVRAGEQVTALAARAATEITLHNQDAVDRLLESMREVAAHEQAARLAARAARDDGRQAEHEAAGEHAGKPRPWPRGSLQWGTSTNPSSSAAIWSSSAWDESPMEVPPLPGHGLT
ncbi:hypothetical protein [Streptomyces albogriseolus]|uniref:hypothetical protein n=1 Tax=Streptomyces albogriseolus TaxID=1887 RepID=UPI003460F0AC